MFGRIVNRVRDMFAPRSVVVKNPRVISADEHRIDPALVSAEARATCEALKRRGFQAYIVGGAVRDLMLGVTPKDFDVATDATPEQVKRCQRRAVIIGRRFKLVHVIFGREIIECSTFRAIEGAGQRKDATGRVVSDNVFGEMWEDAARRDFTVNALYYDPSSETIVDYHHGVADIQQKTLRMIGDPRTRYREDPVRMLRAVRLAAKLGLAIDPAASQPIRDMAILLENVPAARLFDEMLKLLFSGYAVKCLKQLREEGLHHGLLPLLDVILEQPMGERFVTLALENTDERVREDKSVSPGFLFSTLLWHEVLKTWDKKKAAGDHSQPALFEAMDEVLDAQAGKLAITRRIAGDIKDIWAMQPRFDKRAGKAPYRVIEQPRYRAGWDFLRLRAQAGEIPMEIVDWWDDFAHAGPDRREALLRQAPPDAAPAAKKRRRRKRKPAGENAAAAEATLADPS